MRHGALQIPALNVYPEADDDPSLSELEGSELDLLAHEWARLASAIEPSAEIIAEKLVGFGILEISEGAFVGHVMLRPSQTRGC